MKLTAEVAAPSQAAVERAAMNVTAGLARNMVAPKTSYEFEATWKGFANDRQSQSRLLKVHIIVPFSIDHWGRGICSHEDSLTCKLPSVLDADFAYCIEIDRSWSRLHCQKCSRIYWEHHC